MFLARVRHLTDVELDNLIGATAVDYNGNQYNSLISPNDVTLGCNVLVLRTGDTIWRKACPEGARYLFEKHNQDVYVVGMREFHGKRSPCLFIPLDTYRVMRFVYKKSDPRAVEGRDF